MSVSSLLDKLNIASFELTKEGYTDYSKSKVYPKDDDYQNPNPLPLTFLPIKTSNFSVPSIKTNIKEVKKEVKEVKESNNQQQSSSNNIDYTKMTVKELRAHCKSKNIKLYSNKKKDELIKLIIDSEN